MGDAAAALMFAVTMFSGVFLIFTAMKQRSESLERQHRERMAMIEKGQIPPAQPVRRAGSSSLAMSLGIIIIGLGFALMMIISVAAGEPGVGIGIGGAIVILGIAFIVRSLIVRPAETVVTPPPLPHTRTTEEP
jgi:hypothetical protein